MSVQGCNQTGARRCFAAVNRYVEPKMAKVRLTHGDVKASRRDHHRVKDQCRCDRSLAIALDLEGLHVAPPDTPKEQRGRNAAAPPLVDVDENEEDEA